MPGSPSSPASISAKRQSPREKTKTASNTKTPRSVISPAFGPSSRRVSMGSIVNPTTPTKDLVSANVIKYLSGHNVSNAAKVDSSASAVIVTRPTSPSASSPPAGPSQAPGTGTMISGTSPSGTGVANSQAASSGHNSTVPSGQTSYMVGGEEIGHGFIDVNSKTAAIIEIIFGAIGVCSFGGLWIYLMFVAECYQDFFWEIMIKIFSFLGFASSAVAIFHGCLDKRVSIGRGVFGCFVFFQLVLVAVANFVSAYMAMNCICRCAIGMGAISTGSTSDLVIFYASMIGSFSILAILVFASVTHE